MLDLQLCAYCPDLLGLQRWLGAEQLPLFHVTSLAISSKVCMAELSIEMLGKRRTGLWMREFTSAFGLIRSVELHDGQMVGPEMTHSRPSTITER